MKKNKKKEKLTKKQIIILVIITIVLGIICYTISTEITKSVIDHKTMEEKMKNEDFSDLREVETIGNINFDDLISDYNEISDNDINVDAMEDNKIKLDDIEIEFITSNNNVNIVSINFNKKNNTVKSIINDMIKANNQNISEDTADLVYDRVFETLGNTSDDISETSEFFQYQGLEFSLKKYQDNEYKYNFRIGRITEE